MRWTAPGRPEPRAGRGGLTWRRSSLERRAKQLRPASARARRCRCGDAPLGVGQRVGLPGVLLGLDDHPAGIARQLAEDGGDNRPCRRRARCRHRVRTLPSTASRKLQSSRRALRHHVAAHVLGVDMADAGTIAAGERSRVGAAPGRMAGVEQEMRGLAGGRHEGVDIGLALHDGAHVMMVDQPHALGERTLGDLGRCGGRTRPSRRAFSTGRRDSGFDAVAVDGVRGLGEDEHGRSHRLQQIEMRRRRPRSRRRRCASEARPNTSRRRRPCRTAPAPPSGPAGSRGNLWPSSMPSKPASLAPRTGRSRAASRRRAPAGRRWTSRWGWRRCGWAWSSPVFSVGTSVANRSAPRERLVITAARGFADFGALRDFRHRHVPPVAAGIGGGSGSVSMTMTLVRSCPARARRAPLPDRRCPSTFSAMRAERGGVRGEVDLGSTSWRRVAQEIVEARAAGRALQAVDAAEAAVVEHDDGELQARASPRWRSRSSSSGRSRRRPSR